MVRDALLKFTRELSAALVIRSVSETTILVNNEEYSESIALTPEELLGSWPGKSIDALSEIDFGMVLNTGP